MASAYDDECRSKCDKHSAYYAAGYGTCIRGLVFRRSTLRTFRRCTSRSDSRAENVASDNLYSGEATRDCAWQVAHPFDDAKLKAAFMTSRAAIVPGASNAL